MILVFLFQVTKFLSLTGLDKLFLLPHEEAFSLVHIGGTAGMFHPSLYYEVLHQRDGSSSNSDASGPNQTSSNAVKRNLQHQFKK